MKKIIIGSILTTIFIFAGSGGSIETHQEKIQSLSIKQEKIRNHLQEIDNFLMKYDRFAGSYLSQLKEILFEGAKCEIAKEEYLYASETHSKLTFVKKNIYDECLDMKKIRLNAMKDIKVQVADLKIKVNDILELKDLDIKEANRIKSYIDGLRNDIDYYKNSSSF